MDWEMKRKLARGYAFMARSLLAGKITNKVLSILAFLDYRLLIYLSAWHPDMESRKKLLRKRGVKVSDTAWMDMGVWVEITAPQAVIIEDYAKLAYGVVVYAHDASGNSVTDLPMRVLPTRIGYNAAIGTRSLILPGVTVGRHSGVFPGSVVANDVPDMTVVGGNPAHHLCTTEEFSLVLQEDLRRRPEMYYEQPNPHRAPDTPFERRLTWREEGLPVRDCTELRTGTPFDYVLDAKAGKT